MKRVQWKDWVANLEDGWSFLNSYLKSKNNDTKIYLAGLSLGGVLSLIFASTHFSAKYPINGVISMSAPFAFKPDIRITTMGLTQHFLPIIQKDSNELLNQESFPGHVSYSVIPTRGVVELNKLLAELPALLPTISVPTLLLHARMDNNNDYLEPDSMQNIYNKLGTTKKSMYWVETGAHNMLIDVARDEVFNQIASFISDCNMDK
jgi:esterase/lipase